MKKLSAGVLAVLIIWGCVPSGIASASTDNPAEIPTLPTSLIERLHEKDFNDDTIAQIFSDPRIELYPQIVEKRDRGPTCFNGEFGLLGKKSVARGRRILSENYRFFKKLEGLYGVEKEAIVAIYRVETNLGKYTGTYSVFNSLFTMATFPNRRSEWAEEELVQLLVICRNEEKDPLSIKGSWAGAFGLCQFVPSSFLTYGVDGDGDGVVDLFNFPDAMASIANYLKQSGWQRNSVAMKKKAIFAYNHCDNYVRAVLAYAKAMSKS
jgi:membrane-bound lytic murein transglycosylase B